MHNTREFDENGRVEGQEREVVVDVVNHAVSRNDLRRELTEDAGEDDHTESNVKEDELNNIRHVEDVDRWV